MILMVESSLVHAATAALRVPSKSKPCTSLMAFCFACSMETKERPTLKVTGFAPGAKVRYAPVLTTGAGGLGMVTSVKGKL